MPRKREQGLVRHLGDSPVESGAMLGAAGLMIFFAGMTAGLASAGLAFGLMGVLFYLHARQIALLRSQGQARENLAHFLHGGGSAEGMAQIRGAADIGTGDLYSFLGAIKQEYGGESVRGSSRLAGEEQQEAVSPGISLTLAHDLGWWYAKLVLSGDTGRKFLDGEYTQWRGRGRTPQEAVDDVMKKAGASKQQQAIRQYAARLMREAADQ